MYECCNILIISSEKAWKRSNGPVCNNPMWGYLPLYHCEHFRLKRSLGICVHVMSKHAHYFKLTWILQITPSNPRTNFFIRVQYCFLGCQPELQLAWSSLNWQDVCVCTVYMVMTIKTGLGRNRGLFLLCSDAAKTLLPHSLTLQPHKYACPKTHCTLSSSPTPTTTPIFK